jgi:uncharacterized membrane protein
VGALPRLIGHHLDPVSLAVEAVILAVLVLGFGAIWLRERRRRVDRSRRVPELRD